MQMICWFVEIEEKLPQVDAFCKFFIERGELLAGLWDGLAESPRLRNAIDAEA